MYINLEGEEVPLESMTKAFLKNAITRYKALCTSRNLHFEEVRKFKVIKEALEAELKLRSRFRFTIIKEESDSI